MYIGATQGQHSAKNAQKELSPMPNIDPPEAQHSCNGANKSPTGDSEVCIKTSPGPFFVMKDALLYVVL